MNIDNGFNFLLFIKDTYPIAAISIVLAGFGYTLGAIGYRLHIKILKWVLTDVLDMIIKKLR